MESFTLGQILTSCGILKPPIESFTLGHILTSRGILKPPMESVTLGEILSSVVYLKPHMESVTLGEILSSHSILMPPMESHDGDSLHTHTTYHEIIISDFICVHRYWFPVNMLAINTGHEDGAQVGETHYLPPL